VQDGKKISGIHCRKRQAIKNNTNGYGNSPAPKNLGAGWLCRQIPPVFFTRFALTGLKRFFFEAIYVTFYCSSAPAENLHKCFLSPTSLPLNEYLQKGIWLFNKYKRYLKIFI